MSKEKSVWVLDKDGKPIEMTYIQYKSHCFRFASKCGLKIPHWNSEHEVKEFLDKKKGNKNAR